MQRGIFRKTGTGVIFRISRPGVDVNAAGATDFLLHESHLYTQPYFFKFVACPFAGSTSKSALNATVQVTIPNVEANPIVILYPLTGAGRTCFPHQRGFGPGNSQDGFQVDNWFVTFEPVSSTRIDVRFLKPLNSTLSPAGCYLVLMRRPS